MLSLTPLIDRFVKGPLGRDAVRLGARMIGARAMSIFTLIVAAWLVDIEVFAEFGVYQTLAALAGVVLFLRYEAAIVASTTDEEAQEALRLCVAVGFVLLLIFVGVPLLAGGAGLMRMGLALLLPLSILTRGILRLASATVTRDGDFTTMGRTSLIQAVVQPTVLILLVLSPLENVLSFALADVIGHASAAAYLTWRQGRHLNALRRGWSGSGLAAAARHWRGLPIYNLPGTFFSVGFVMSPLLILPVAAHADFAGHVALAYRIFDVPTQIISAVSTPLFLNRLRPSSERASPIFGRRMMLAFVAAIGLGYLLMGGVLVLADPWLVGTELAGLAEAVPFVALFQLFVALGAPLSDSCTLYPQQRRLVTIQGLALLGGAALLVFAHRIAPDVALLLLASMSVLRTLALGELLRKLSSISRMAASGAPHHPTSRPIRASRWAAADLDRPSRS